MSAGAFYGPVGGDGPPSRPAETARPNVPRKQQWPEDKSVRTRSAESRSVAEMLADGGLTARGPRCDRPAPRRHLGR